MAATAFIDHFKSIIFSLKANNKPLHAKKLGAKFFSGTRNTLSLSKLRELSEFAKGIPEPDLFGHYQDEAHYQKTLHLMLQSTCETRHRGIFFKRMILPKLAHREKMLDIGPGDGQLTRWLANSFKSITLIESNKNIIDSLNFRSTKKYVLEKIHGSILDVKLKNNCYDLILLSHILYYLKRSDWLPVVKAVYAALRPGGMVVIALSGDAYGKADLIRHFGGENICIDPLANQCVSLYGSKNVKLFSSKEKIITLDLNAMTHICGFFLYDAGVTTSKELLTDYIKNEFYSVKDYYYMSSQQKFVVLSKPPL